MKNIYVPKSIAILFLGMAAIAVGSAVAKTVPANNLSQAKGNAVAGTAVVAQVQTVFAASSSPANVSSSVPTSATSTPPPSNLGISRPPRHNRESGERE